MDLQVYFEGEGLEIGRGESDRLGLSSHSNCKVAELFEENKFWVTQPDFVGVDACGLPFPDCCLNFIANSHLLEHILDPYGALEEWKRVLKVGGFVIVAVPDKDHSQYPDGVYLDRHRPRSKLDQVLSARGRRLPEGRPRTEYNKGLDGLNKLPKWVGEWTGYHHWAWKLPDIVQLFDCLEFEVEEAKQFHPDKYSFTVIARKVM